MTTSERKAYERVLMEKNFMAIRRLSWNVGDLNNSSKYKRLIEIIEDAKEDDRKLVVFSFFLDTINTICHLLGPICSRPITGAVPADQRQAIIDDFDKAPAGSVLIAQIMTGGVGLNIQSASVVVLCEPQFKPSTESQAISRVYRMGQSRNVLVHRLLCADTIEERLLQRLNVKQEEFDKYADESLAAQSDMAIDDSTFSMMIEEELAHINK